MWWVIFATKLLSFASNMKCAFCLSLIFCVNMIFRGNSQDFGDEYPDYDDIPPPRPGRPRPGRPRPPPTKSKASLDDFR